MGKAMDLGVLEGIAELLGAELPSLQVQGTGMQAVIDARYARITVRFDFDPDAESIRMYTIVPPPAGSGHEFLIWCLSMNTLYWDVKIGLDSQGMLLVHSDVDLDQADLTTTTRVLIQRAVTMRELLDDDLVEYMLRQGLATPAQEQRWRAAKRA